MYTFKKKIVQKIKSFSPLRYLFLGLSKRVGSKEIAHRVRPRMVSCIGLKFLLLLNNAFQCKLPLSARRYSISFQLPSSKLANEIDGAVLFIASKTLVSIALKPMCQCKKPVNDFFHDNITCFIWITSLNRLGGDSNQ